MKKIATIIVAVFVSLVIADIVSATDPKIVIIPTNKQTVTAPATKNGDAIKKTKPVPSPSPVATPTAEDRYQKAVDTVTSSNKQTHDDAQKIIDNLK